MSRHATGDRAVFASGGEGDAESHLVGTVAWTSGADRGPRPPRPRSRSTSPTAATRRTSAPGSSPEPSPQSLTDQAITAASQVWRGGRCLELKADPPGKEVDPGSERRSRSRSTTRPTTRRSSATSRPRLTGPRRSTPLAPGMAPGHIHLHRDPGRRARAGSPAARSRTAASPSSPRPMPSIERLLIDVDATTSMEVGGMD